MPDQPTDGPRDLPIINLLPNVLTLIAICAGLTAIRFGYQGDFETSVRLVVFAAILDGLDGRLARLLGVQSSVGAELDSLADFLNFGVAPGLIIHAWALQDFHSLGWPAVLAYTICCVMRLARFNVSNKQDGGQPKEDFFVGVPSPAGALLAMLPMYVAFLFDDASLTPPALVAAYIFVVGLLMISRIPTYSFKNVKVSRANAKFLMLGAVLVLSALFTYLWLTLVLLVLAYGASMVMAFWAARKSAK